MRQLAGIMDSGGQSLVGTRRLSPGQTLLDVVDESIGLATDFANDVRRIFGGHKVITHEVQRANCRLQRLAG